MGQYHLLQRYLPRIRETGAQLVVVTGEDTEALSTFMNSAQPALEYKVLADPKRSANRAVRAGSDTMAIIADGGGVVRWFERWASHQGEPEYEIILQALREVGGVE